MPTHLFTRTEKYGFKSWTIKEIGTPENIDDRSTGVVQFLNAIMPKEFPDRFKAGQPPLHRVWVTPGFPASRVHRLKQRVPEFTDENFLVWYRAEE